MPGSFLCAVLSPVWNAVPLALYVSFYNSILRSCMLYVLVCYYWYLLYVLVCWPHQKVSADENIQDHSTTGMPLPITTRAPLPGQSLGDY